jgi:hypothetical protein
MHLLHKGGHVEIARELDPALPRGNHTTTGARVAAGSVTDHLSAVEQPRSWPRAVHW